MEQLIQETLITRLQDVMAGHGFDLFVKNGPEPDLVNQPRPFVFAQVTVDEIFKASLERGRGLQRYSGSMEIALYARSGTGSAAINALRTDLNDVFIGQYVGQVIMENALKLRPADIPQWYGEGVEYLFCANLLPGAEVPVDPTDPDVPEGAAVGEDGNILTDQSGNIIIAESA